MKKSLILILVAVVLVVVGWFIWSAPRQASAPETSADADLSEINSVDLGDVDSGFQAIDADLNQL